LRGAEAVFLEIQIVHDFADAADDRIVDAKTPLQDLEGVAIALVTEPGFVHVERDSATRGEATD
jgi:hypothetical protein